MGGVLGGAVAEDIRHVVEHPKHRQRDRRSAYVGQVVQEELRVPVPLLCRPCKIIHRRFSVRRYLPTQQIELAEGILRVLVVLLGRCFQVFDGCVHVLLRVFSSEIDLAQRVPGVLVASVGGIFEPADGLRGEANRQQELSESVGRADGRNSSWTCLPSGSPLRGAANFAVFLPFFLLI